MSTSIGNRKIDNPGKAITLDSAMETSMARDAQMGPIQSLETMNKEAARGQECREQAKIHREFSHHTRYGSQLQLFQKEKERDRQVSRPPYPHPYHVSDPCPHAPFFFFFLFFFFVFFFSFPFILSKATCFGQGFEW